MIALQPNVPNPFNPTTKIEFILPEAATIELSIYDLSGRLVRSLVSSTRYEAGSHWLTWDGQGDNGHPLSSGICLYRLQAGAKTESRKMALIR